MAILILSNRNRSRGSVIILSLFTVTLIALLSTHMMRQQSMNVYQTQRILHAQQFYLYHLMVVDQLRQVLKKSPHEMTQNLPFQNIETRVIDAQSVFNLNNLDSSVFRKYFIRLLDRLSSKPHQKLVQSMKAILMKQHHLIDSDMIQELPEMTNDLFIRLRPYIIALSEKTKVNINTASPMILKSLFTKPEERWILNHRPFERLSDVEHGPLNNGADTEILNNLMTVKSHYFWIKSRSTQGHSAKNDALTQITLMNIAKPTLRASLTVSKRSNDEKNG